MNYDAYERELLELTEDPGFEPAPIDETRKAMLETAAEEQTERMERKKQISLKVRESDLLRIKQKAKEVSIPYQNIIQALLHKYAKGEIKLEI
jgi:predicted DNA binding CopG/RHH family protein